MPEIVVVNQSATPCHGTQSAEEWSDNNEHPAELGLVGSNFRWRSVGDHRQCPSQSDIRASMARAPLARRRTQPTVRKALVATRKLPNHRRACDFYRAENTASHRDSAARIFGGAPRGDPTRALRAQRIDNRESGDRTRCFHAFCGEARRIRPRNSPFGPGEARRSQARQNRRAATPRSRAPGSPSTAPRRHGYS